LNKTIENNKCWKLTTHVFILNVEISKYFFLCKLNSLQKLSKILTKFWTKLAILRGEKMPFCTTYFLEAQRSPPDVAMKVVF